MPPPLHVCCGQGFGKSRLAIGDSLDQLRVFFPHPRRIAFGGEPEEPADATVEQAGQPPQQVVVRQADKR